MTTEKQLAGNQRRTLRTMRDRLLKMANEWDGIDQFNVTELTELADKADQVAKGLSTDDSGEVKP